MVRILIAATLFCLIAPHALVAGEPKKSAEVPLDQEAIIRVLKAELKSLETSLAKDIGGKLDGFKTTIQLLQGDIANLKAQQLELKAQLDAQKTLIDQLTEERKKITANSSPSPVSDKNLEEIRSRLAAIENGIAKLGPTEKRVLNYGPNAASTSRMMLVNLFSDSVLYTVNGTDHIVPAGRSKAVEGLPVGTIRYEVFSGRHGFLDSQSVNLLAGETFTLTVYPKR